MPQSKLDPLALAKKGNLMRAIGWYWLGRRLAPKECELLEKIFIICLDHGPDSPSAKATIAAAKGGKDLLRSVEAGVSEINERHGGAIEGLARILKSDRRSEDKIVAEYLAEDKRLPGFGHRLYKDKDPRAEYLLKQADKLGYAKTVVVRARRLEAELEKQKGQKLVLNIDGALAAILLELKVPVELMNAFFLWPRVAGLVHQYGHNRKR